MIAVVTLVAKEILREKDICVWVYVPQIKTNGTVVRSVA